MQIIKKSAVIEEKQIPQETVENNISTTNNNDITINDSCRIETDEEDVSINLLGQKSNVAQNLTDESKIETKTRMRD